MDIEDPTQDLRTNWSGVHRFRATAIHQPETLDEARRLVAQARHIRTIGARHSFNAVADSEGGELLSLLRIPAGVVVDRDRMVVSVSGGTRYADLGAALEEEGLALHNLASLPHITAAGAVSTGTHGSGDGNGSLATAVRGVELIRPDGTLTEVDSDHADWAGFPVALGYLGIVSRITLAVQPSFQVRQNVYRDVPWDQVLGRFDEIMGTAYSVSIFTRWRAPAVEQLWVKSVGGSGAPAPRERFGGVLAPETSSIPALEGDNVTARDGSAGPWSQRLPHFRAEGIPSWGEEVQTEYMVDRAHGVEALVAVRALADRIEPRLLATELRTVAADGLWLSEMFERPTLCIHFTWKKEPERVAALLPDIEAALAPFAPRPHWGKLFAASAAQLRERYPLLPRFTELVRAWDPDGTFGNDFYRTYFEEG